MFLLRFLYVSHDAQTSVKIWLEFDWTLIDAPSPARVSPKVLRRFGAPTSRFAGSCFYMYSIDSVCFGDVLSLCCDFQRNANDGTNLVRIRLGNH